MKKIFLSIICFLACLLSIQAQTLYGTTFEGGKNGQGTIIKFIPATNTLTAPVSFEGRAANPSYTTFIQATDGKLYGMTSKGGSMDRGVIFSLDPSSSAYTRLQDFNGLGGDVPGGSLMQASDGKLYGMTSEGGTNNVGVIFSFDPSSSTYTKLKDFDGTDGRYPEGNLIQATNGKLYGMTYEGGTGNVGVIFSYDPSSSAYTKLKDFNVTDGDHPLGSFIQESDGNLYGMTSGGGSSGYGVIFSFDPATSTYTKLKDLNQANGGQPSGSLIKGSDGNLYGLTSVGGSGNIGVIFSFEPSSSTYTKLKDFDSTNGFEPLGSLLQGTDGKLYGMTAYGGSSGVGVIFSFDPSSSTYTKLEDFDNINGRRPNGSLMEGSNGKLYGMTTYGGSHFVPGTFDGFGIIFSFDPVASTYTKLKDFDNTLGRNPSGSLTLANDGKLYGMTVNGGSTDGGVIFSFDPVTSVYAKLRDFDTINGRIPTGSLMLASDGKLYGTAALSTGASSSQGVIFSFDPSSSVYTVLKEFEGGINGGQPFGNLTQASDGKLYGETQSGGTTGFGVIFSFDPSGGIYTKLKDLEFDARPSGSLVQASDGKLYGTTMRGGALGVGVIFSIDPSTSVFTNLKDFDFTNGNSPTGSLTLATDGKLYGTTLYGGSRDSGVIFSFDPLSSTYTKLKDLENSTGANPLGSLMQASDGKLYGMDQTGGDMAYTSGIIFSFDPTTSTYTNLKNFDFTYGIISTLSSAFVEVESGSLPVTLIDFTGKNNGNTNELSWKVGNEQHLNYYELQRSIDGQNFKGISQITATGNTSYTYNDPVSAASSLYYYRLKSVDKDGNFKYSVVIKIRKYLNGFAVVNPNPFKDRLVVNVESFIQDKATFIVTDLSGKQLYKESKLLSPGNNVIEINETGRLSKGTYLLTIMAFQQTQSIKIVKGN